MKFECLVVEPSRLIADDLAELVEEVAPGTVVRVASSMHAAVGVVPDWGRIALAFVGFAPGQLRVSALGAALAQNRVTVVYLGHEREADAAGHRYLERPFAGVAVKSELDRVWRGLKP